MAGLPLGNVQPRETDCALPAYSTVPFRDVMNAAFEHLVKWIDDETPPPIAPDCRWHRRSRQSNLREIGSVIF